MEKAKPHPKRVPRAEEVSANDPWYTKDLKAIPICELKDPHLLNIINLLQKGARISKDMKDMMYIEMPAPNGEQAQVAFEAEQKMVWSKAPMDYLDPRFWNLVQEAEDRGLDFDVWIGKKPEEVEK